MMDTRRVADTYFPSVFLLVRNPTMDGGAVAFVRVPILRSSLWHNGRAITADQNPLNLREKNKKDGG